MDDQTPDTTAADPGYTADNAVPAAVTAKFDELFSNRPANANANGSQDEQDELVQEGVVTPDGNDPKEEQTIRPESSDDGADKSEAGEDGKPSKEQKPAGQAPALDPFLRFAGINSGLTDDQIDKFHAADPEAATATLTALADQFTNLSRQYAGLPGSPVIPAPQGVEQQPAQQQAPTPQWDKFMSQLASFTEANGEDIGGLVKALNDEFVGPLKSLMAANAVREQDLIRQEAVQGFEAVRGQFADFYGPENGNLTPEQQQARVQVAQIADQIKAGAKAQGRNVSIPDAIKRAHSIVTHDMRATAARRELIAKVQKRAGAATVKPSQRRTVATGERSDAAAEAAFRQKATEIGLDD